MAKVTTHIPYIKTGFLPILSAKIPNIGAQINLTPISTNKIVEF